MSWHRLTIFTLASLYIALTNAIPPGPVINLGYVSLVGNSTTPTGVANGSVHFFGAVPFAQPPLGKLRFKAPQALDETPRKNAPILDARSFGPPCIQQNPATVGVGSEGGQFVLY